MKQEPVIEQPAAAASATPADRGSEARVRWDYLYEPDAQRVIDELMVRYVEALVYQAVAENMPQSSRRAWWR